MEIDISEKSLPFYEALASKVRIQIIQLLAKKPMNVKELAQALGLSSAIMTMHVKKLEKGGIIRTEMTPGKGGVQKVCVLNVKTVEIQFPEKQEHLREYHLTEVSVGHYTDFQVAPTCGLATTERVIGQFDDPRFFLDPDRFNAKILWLGQGYVEYKIPNYLLASEMPEELEITLELSSEAPFAETDWPSDISFFMNGLYLGKWTSPGDFADYRGKYTPSWWDIAINQYGILKKIKINALGTFIHDQMISDVTLDMLDIRQKQWTFRVAVLEDAEHIGGMTLFGTGFGNYNQDIQFKLFYTKGEMPVE